MSRTLFAGDLHAKGDLLPFISNMADREHADRIVLLGDICDDWHVSNTGMIRFMVPGRIRATGDRPAARQP